MADGDQINIGQVIRNALVFNPSASEGNISTHSDHNVVREPSSDALLDAVDRFFGLLENRGIDYVLVGGVAMLQYVAGRNTEDLDLIVDPSVIDELPELDISGRDGDFVRSKFEGLQIDLLLSSNSLFEKVLRDYSVKRPFQKRDVLCGSVEGLILLKLFALPSLYRQGNFTRVGLYENDVATLLYEHEVDLEPLFEELRGHLSETDLAEVSTIIEEITDRLERFRYRKRDNNE